MVAFPRLRRRRKSTARRKVSHSKVLTIGGLTGALIAGGALLTQPQNAHADEIHVKARDAASASLHVSYKAPFYDKLPDYVQDTTGTGVYYFTGYPLSGGGVVFADLTVLHPTNVNR